MTDVTSLRYLVPLAVHTIRDPKSGAEAILALNLPRAALYLAFSLVVVGSLMLGEVVTMIAPPVEEGPLTGRSALALGLMQAAILFVAVHAITQIGRIFDGHGTFDGALALITWLQFIFLGVQLVQLVLMIVLPPFAPMISVIAIGLFFWLLVNFIATLHGFSSVGMVFVMTLVSFIGILFTLSLVLTILGVALPGTAPSGV
ncbi:Yip1 family protein [Hasllibacter sp. MH4015]|uniref:Yip1 family protein n=1 Tax=Hasllibacter sp. MH4015 TaxID=2854029 RepID=UPI001CD2B998|nr:Yip1 family protein [Hasllibacter sp. MH4015]